MYHLGYDYFTSEPNSGAHKYCYICAELCDVERNILGPTSSIEAMAQGEHWHDKYTCPNVEYDWHKKAYKLFLFIENCPSDILNSIVKTELEKVIAEK